MIQLLITVSILAFIAMTHVLVWKWAAYLQEKYATDERKTRVAAFVLFMSLAALFALLAFVLIRTSS